MYDYLSTSDIILTNQLLKVSLEKWYIVDKYIDEHVCDDEKEYYKNWIRLVRKNTVGHIYLKIQPHHINVMGFDQKFINSIGYHITLRTDM
jgi:hypothetical protein